VSWRLFAMGAGYFERIIYCSCHFSTFFILVRKENEDLALLGVNYCTILNNNNNHNNSFYWTGETFYLNKHFLSLLVKKELFIFATLLLTFYLCYCY
jgi:hypothetical protein